MNNLFNKISTEVYIPSGLTISNTTLETESKEYEACRFDINGHKVVYRTAKTTPKKAGQFVTFWKRNQKGTIEPLHETDPIDFYIITVSSNELVGLFIIPKAVLIQRGIISTERKEGKRGFRIYPVWDKVTSKLAEKTQIWQLKHFYLMNEPIDFNKINQLFRTRSN